MKTVYGVTPDTESGKFIVMEVQLQDAEYYKMKPSGAIFDSKKEAEAFRDKFAKQYNKRK